MINIMAVPFDTLLLDIQTWDLTTDSQNNIAVATSPYSVAQDMGSQCRQWRGDYIYDANAGVPLSTILGESPSLALVKSDFVTAAAQVPGVSNVVCYISSVTNRNVQGQVQGSIGPGSNNVVATQIGGQTTVLRNTFRLDTSTLGGPDVLG